MCVYVCVCVCVCVCIMVTRVSLCVSVCMSTGASERVWYGFALLACPYTRAWSDAYVCFCVCAILTCVLLVCCVCVRAPCVKHVSLSVCVRMSECMWHTCVMFAHLFKRVYGKCSCARLLSGSFLHVGYLLYTYVCVWKPCVDASQVA